MADVIAIDIVMILIALRLMLLPNIVVDVKTTFWQVLHAKWQKEWPLFVTGGRCYCLVAHVIATVGCVFGYVCLLQADGIALGLLQL